jgi:hypothetical protein
MTKAFLLSVGNSKLLPLLPLTLSGAADVKLELEIAARFLNSYLL